MFAAANHQAMISLDLECQKRIEENYQLKEWKTKVMACDLCMVYRDSAKTASTPEQELGIELMPYIFIKSFRLRV